jgi:hypothetical protein
MPADVARPMLRGRPGGRMRPGSASTIGVAPMKKGAEAPFPVMNR